MADATLTNVIEKLEEVKSAVKSSKVAPTTEKVTAAEATTEPDTSIFQAISDKLDIFKGMKSEVTPDEASAGAALEVARDVVKKLEEVKSAVKAGEVATGAERLAAGEAAAEGARTDAKRMGIFQAISDKLNIFKGMKTDDKKAKGFFSSLLGGFKWAGLMSSFGSLILTGLSTAFTSLGTLFGPGMIKFFKGASPWALIIAGLSMAIEDGITGYLSADEWGTSKIGAFFGGFFGGDAKGGMKNAFKNAGKFALIGAGKGALLGAGIFSIPGMIIGGLLGAAVGGILGYIGGEKLAKSFDKIGVWFKKQFDDLILGPIKAV